MMGANPYCYFTSYAENMQDALDELRAAEFSAGRYERCFEERTGKYLFEFELAPRGTFPAPGNCHASLEDVYEALDESGTNSILDIFRTVDTPFETVADPMWADDIMERMNTSAPVSEEELASYFGTPKPSVDQIKEVLLATGQGDDLDLEIINNRDAFWMQMGRGQSRYIVAYKDGAPDQIFFAGFSFD